ncbi:MAG: tetratricopeptide repeat protein [Verrucomicrobiota bacterium]|jgi:hypothetical protein
MNAPWQIAAGSIALLLLLALSHPPDLRPTRWTKIAVSAPLIGWVIWFADKPLAAESGFVTIMALVSLGFLWRHNMAWFIARMLSVPIYRYSGTRGFRPSFTFARSAFRDEDWAEAERLTRLELAKEPANYEGLMLLVAIYEQRKQLRDALTLLESISENPGTTEAQREKAREMRHAFERKLGLRSLETQRQPRFRLK